MRFRLLLAAVGVLVAGASMAAMPARATVDDQVTADEPQYLLSAISLAEDGDLDIADELTVERWRAFHRSPLPRQTEPRGDGRELSPHDPLLPLLLAVPVALGGWAGAKVALAAAAGALAALLVWVGVRRLRLSAPIAAGVVAAFATVPPLTTYGAQVYPELPAALVVTAAVAALTGPLHRRGTMVLGLAVVALPWLAVKYVPVAAALAAVGLVALARRGHRLTAIALGAALAAAGTAFAAFHRAVYGGWTAYAAGDHFTGGELTAVGTAPSYPGRAVRLLGLLVDRGFGLAAWAPVFLLAVPAMAALLRRRPAGWAALAVPFAAGWLNATFVALTMHGWWWPGRQVVVVVPALVLVTAWWVDQVRRVLPVVVAATVAGLTMWWWLLVEVLSGRRTLIVDFVATADPLARAWHAVLPDYRTPTATTWALHAAWTVALGALAAWGWTTAAPTPSRPPVAPTAVTSPPTKETAHVHA